MSVIPFSAYALVKDLYKLVARFFTEKEIDALVWPDNGIAKLIEAGRLEPPEVNYRWSNPDRAAMRVEIDQSHHVAWGRDYRRKTKRKVVREDGSVLLRRRAG